MTCLAGLLGLGFICNLLVRPVPARFFMTDEEVAKDKRTPVARIIESEEREVHADFEDFIEEERESGAGRRLQNLRSDASDRRSSQHDRLVSRLDGGGRAAGLERVDDLAENGGDVSIDAQNQTPLSRAADGRQGFIKHTRRLLEPNGLKPRWE